MLERKTDNIAGVPLPATAQREPSVFTAEGYLSLMPLRILSAPRVSLLLGVLALVSLVWFENPLR